MRSALLAIALAPLLAGCPALDVMEGKESPYKANHERRMLLTTPEPTPPIDSPAVLTLVDVEPPEPAAPEPEPVAEPVVAEVAPEPEPTPEPVCVPVFRVTTCD